MTSNEIRKHLWHIRQSADYDHDRINDLKERVDTLTKLLEFVLKHLAGELEEGEA